MAERTMSVDTLQALGRHPKAKTLLMSCTKAFQLGTYCTKRRDVVARAFWLFITYSTALFRGSDSFPDICTWTERNFKRWHSVFLIHIQADFCLYLFCTFRLSTDCPTPKLDVVHLWPHHPDSFSQYKLSSTTRRKIAVSLSHTKFTVNIQADFADKIQKLQKHKSKNNRKWKLQLCN